MALVSSAVHTAKKSQLHQIDHLCTWLHLVLHKLAKHTHPKIFKIAISVHLWQSKAITKLSHHMVTSQRAQHCPTQRNPLIGWVHSVAGVHSQGAATGLQSLKFSSYKTEKLLEQYPWGWYGLSPTGHFYIPPLGGVWGILRPRRWSHHRVDWWWWCMRDITFTSKTPAPLSYFSEAVAEHHAKDKKSVH